MEEEDYAKELSRYLHLNPVRARLVQRPEQHRWSSYAAYIGAAEAPEWLCREEILTDFGKSLAEAQARYRAFVEAGLTRDLPNPFDDVVASTILGGVGFVEWVKQGFLEGQEANRDLPALTELSERPTIGAVRAAVEKEVVADPRQARRVALYLCHRLTGLRLKEIGETFGVGESAVTQASRRVRGQLQGNPGLVEMVKRLEAGLNMSEV